MQQVELTPVDEVALAMVKCVMLLGSLDMLFTAHRAVGIEHTTTALHEQCKMMMEWIEQKVDELVILGEAVPLEPEDPEE